MCGIIGALATTNQEVATTIYDALTIIQHRGQDAGGIATIHHGRVHMRKAKGLVRNVFRTKHMLNLQGNIGIGHVRYPTAGSSSPAEAQPFYVNSPYGIAFVHNGNLVNTQALAQDLRTQDRRHLNTDSDSEVMLNVLASELSKGTNKSVVENIFQAVTALNKRVSGGYACIAAVTNTFNHSGDEGDVLFGFRDKHGIRPLILGKRTTRKGEKYLLASESVALTALGYDIVRDVAPGEVIIINQDGEVFSRHCADKAQYTPCIFEFVYFARPDSEIDNISVYKTRLRMGDKLAKKIQKEWSETIDVVIPVPDTSRTSALELASTLGIKYREGFVKNRYIARTFIMPEQKLRTKSVRQKLSAIKLEFYGKNVLLVDDSIVRGTTSKEIVQMARDVGAKKVFFASAAPAVRYPNVYGIDMAAEKDFVAHDRSTQEVCDVIGADKLIYQDLDDLIWSVSQGNPNISHFDTSCFDGKYVTEDVDETYLKNVEMQRSNKNKTKDNQTNIEISCHNVSSDTTDE